MYANGKGISRNYSKAAKWLRKAADQGIASAQYNLGLMYANGNGVPKDYSEAEKWYRKAADQEVVATTPEGSNSVQKRSAHKAEEALSRAEQQKRPPEEEEARRKVLLKRVRDNGFEGEPHEKFDNGDPRRRDSSDPHGDFYPEL